MNCPSNRSRIMGKHGTGERLVIKDSSGAETQSKSHYNCSSVKRERVEMKLKSSLLVFFPIAFLGMRCSLYCGPLTLGTEIQGKRFGLFWEI